MNRKNSKLIDSVARLIKGQVQIKKYKSKDRIYVMHIDTDVASLYIGDDIVAKRIQDEKKLDVTAVSLKEEEEVKKIDEAFGFEVNNLLDKPCKIIRVWLAALFVMLFKRSNILGLKYRGIKIGDALYDELVVRYSVENKGFTCKNWDWRIGFPLLIKSFNAIENIVKEFKRFPPKCLVIHEANCYRGLIAVAAEHYGSDIVLVSPDYGAFLPVLSADIKKTYKLKGQYILYLIVKESMKKGYSYWRNKCGDNMYLFQMHKNEVKEKNQLLRELGINNNKKNVFILLHCFSDCCRELATTMPFKDFEEWFVETLDCVKNVKDTNWIIKDHPLSKMYAQDKHIKEIYKTYKADNIFFMDNKYDGNAVQAIADCVVTCEGDAGCEYVGYGIPTITSAGTAYVSMGISNNAKSKEEYFQLLKNVNDIKPVSEEEKKRARCYIAIFQNLRSDYKNEFIQLSWKQRAKIWGFGEQRVKLDVSNEEFLLGFCELLQRMQLDKLEWYFVDGLK